MRVYKHHRTEQPLKWIMAVILFCLVLGWAMTDVYGGEVGGLQQVDGNSCGEQGTYPPQNAPSAVPEPTTLVLLALGLGGAVVYRKLKK